MSLVHGVRRRAALWEINLDARGDSHSTGFGRLPWLSANVQLVVVDIGTYGS